MQLQLTHVTGIVQSSLSCLLALISL